MKLQGCWVGMWPNNSRLSMSRPTEWCWNAQIEPWVHLGETRPDPRWRPITYMSNLAILNTKIRHVHKKNPQPPPSKPQRESKRTTRAYITKPKENSLQCITSFPCKPSTCILMDNINANSYLFTLWSINPSFILPSFVHIRKQVVPHIHAT